MTDNVRRMADVYDDPAAYAVAYNFRAYAAECDFLCAATLQTTGRPPRTAAELGAGPACHARELARRGIKAYAVDNHPAMLAYLRANVPQVTAVEGDLRSFALPQPVDLVYCPLATFAYLLTDGDWDAALAAARAALVPRGTLVLEFVPGDSAPREAMAWQASDGEVTVDVLAGPTRPADGDTYTWDLKLRITRGETITERASTQRQRRVSAAEIETGLRRAGHFGAVQLYGDWSLGRRWRGDATVVAVARRR